MDVLTKFETVKDFKFTEAFGKKVAGRDELFQKFRAAIEDTGLPENVRNTVNDLSVRMKSAEEALLQVADVTRDGYKIKPGVEKQVFDDAVKLNNTTCTEFANFLKGAENAGVKVTDALKTAFTEAEKATAKVVNTINGKFTGALQSQGVKAAFNQNFDSIKNAFGKDVTMGQRGVGFAKVGGVGVAVVGMGDAIFRSKTKEGEDRSALVRLSEFVLSLAVGTFALLGGRAAAPVAAR